MATENFNEAFKKNMDNSIKTFQETTSKLFQETTSKLIEAQTKQFELVNSLFGKSMDASLNIWSELLENMNTKKTGKTNTASDYRKNGSAPENKNSVVKQTIEN